MAGPTGFEPATSRLTIWRPNLAERRPRNNLVAGQTAHEALPQGELTLVWANQYIRLS
jgi:hypothetical protein